MNAITPRTVLAAFVAVVAVKLLVVPLLRDWPEDKPATRRLRRMKSAGQFFDLLFSVARAYRTMTGLPKEGRIPREVLQKAKLAVSGANECAHCTFLHSRLAFEIGVGKDEVRDLVAGRFEGQPEAEVPALRFARHYAGTGGDVSDEELERAAGTYGQVGVDHLAAWLAAVDFGNLCCNTVHYFEHGKLDHEERKEIYLAYLLSRPVDWFLMRSAIRHDIYGGLKRS